MNVRLTLILSTLILSALIMTCSYASAQRVTDKSKSVSVPRGFEVVLFADENLANDIYSMTIDSRGRVVVSGRGYVKILIDTDRDGRADKAKLFVNGPRTGAQGMYFDGQDLLCVGDAGLIRYRDADGDDRADGAAETLLKVRAGGEHHAHSIQRGPDGYWYLIAGNYGGVTKNTINHPGSPIKRPRFGTLVRLSPDFKRREVVSDGYRNSYDFAFHRQGDVFVYDSDGERDVSLPWYRPTRVFQAIPGANAGWFDRSWKRPNHYFEMQPVMGEFGRGSPTGVASYRHTQFPAAYRDAIFALDWTYGRVLMLPLAADGSVWKSRPSVFMKGEGNFGFAPTDVAVAPSGDLYVSVGGRGTRGSVYRVRFTGAVAGSKRSVLAACLLAPQPLSSWSRRRWLPLARRLGANRLQAVIGDSRAPEAARVRAVEIVTELFDGVNESQLAKITSIKSAAVKSRIAWAIGRSSRFGDAQQAALDRLLRDQAPLVQRFALESLIGRPKRAAKMSVEVLADRLSSPHRFVRAQAARVTALLDKKRKTAVLNAVGKNRVGTLSYWIGVLARKEIKAMDSDAMIAFRVGMSEAFDRNQLLVHRLAATRLVQLALGDVGPGTDGAKHGPVFLGYGRRVALSEGQLPKISSDSFLPTGDPLLDRELTRILAMLQLRGPEFQSLVVSNLSDKSHPVEDIHNLIVLARLGANGQEHRSAIAKALVGLEQKIESRKLYQDNNWEPRVREITRQLVNADPELAKAMVDDDRFGHPGHLMFLRLFSRELRKRAVDKMVRLIRRQGEDYVWSNGMIFELGKTGDADHLKLVRDQFANFSVRDAVLDVLARRSVPSDRQRFVKGLGSSQVNIVNACAQALLKLKEEKESGEYLAVLLAGLRRLGRERNEVGARDRIVKLLRRSTKQKLGYQFARHSPQTPVVNRWTEYLRKRYPKQIDALLGADTNAQARFTETLRKVPWNKGDAARGKQLYVKRSCAQCHGGRRALGPDLRGVAQRFSRQDLFTAIRFPNRDVSPRYQTLLIQLESGKSISGLVIYESIDGLILRNGTNQTFRIESRDIESRRRLRTSLMPAGLLKGLKPTDWADLYAYLRGLRK